MNRFERLHWLQMDALAKRLKAIPHVQTPEISFQENECRDYEIRHHLEKGSVKWKDLLYHRGLITYEQLQNYKDDTNG